MNVRGFMAVKFSDLPAEGDIEVYFTDSENVVLEKGRLMKGKIKGPAAQVVFRFALPVEKAGAYTFWARLDGGEPVRLVQWTAEEK